MGGEVLALLTPLLPLLFGRVTDAVSHALRKRADVRAAEEFWELLGPHLSQNQLLAAAFEQLARHPDDEQAKRLAALSLDALFTEDRPLADAGQQLIQVGRDMIAAGPGAAVSTGSGVAASGSATAVGGDYFRIGADDPWARIRAATGPRRAVILVGLSLALLGFALFVAGIFSLSDSSSSGFPPLIIVGFVLFLLGGVVSGVASELFGPRD